MSDALRTSIPRSRTLPGFALFAALSIMQGCPPKIDDGLVTFVDVTKAQKLARGGKGVLGMGESTSIYVDPRDADEFANGHIPGALSMPFVVVNQEHKRLDDYDVIIVYGNDFSDDIGKMMAKRLMYLKHDDVNVLQGGLRAWEQAGNRIDKGAPASP